VGGFGTDIVAGVVARVQTLATSIGAHLPLVVAAAAVGLLSWLLANLTLSVTQRVLARTSTKGHVDLLVARFAKACVLSIGIVVALGIVGVNVGALIASLGLVGLTIGLALKDVLANYVSGIMLLLQGPFTVGDSIVVDGVEGTVIDVKARATALRAGDGREIHIPNSTMFAATVVNSSRDPIRRFDIVLSVPADVDLVSARGVVLAAVSDVGGVLADPGADAQISSIGAAWARITAHGWVDTREHGLGDAQAAALVVAARRLHEAGLAPSTRRSG
jgi:small conductance mechanosensitive channel